MMLLLVFHSKEKGIRLVDQLNMAYGPRISLSEVQPIFYKFIMVNLSNHALHMNVFSSSRKVSDRKWELYSLSHPHLKEKQPVSSCVPEYPSFPVLRLVQMRRKRYLILILIVCMLRVVHSGMNYLDGYR